MITGILIIVGLVTMIVSLILSKRYSEVLSFQILLIKMQCEYLEKCPIQDCGDIDEWLSPYIPTQKELFWKFGTPLTPEAWLPKRILIRLTKYS